MWRLVTIVWNREQVAQETRPLYIAYQPLVTRHEIHAQLYWDICFKPDSSATGIKNIGCLLDPTHRLHHTLTFAVRTGP